MPRLSHALPKYRKHKASGQAICTIRGKDHYLGPHGTKASKAAYDRLISEWLASGRCPLGAAGPEDDLTISEVILAYWSFAKKHYRKQGKPTSEQASLRWALKPLREMYGGTSAIEFGPLALKAIRFKYIEHGLSRLSVNQNVGRIVRMFRWAASEELLPASVPQSLQTVAGLRKGRSEANEYAPVSPVTDETLEATLPHLPAIVSDMVRIQRDTGMRPAEICSLRPCDLDRSEDEWTYRPESHKTEHHGRERKIPIGPKAQEVLLRYLGRDPQAYCFRPCDSEQKRRAAQHADRKTPLSYGNRPGSNRQKRPKRTAGEKYTPDSYRRAVNRACTKAGIESWSPNRLRHAAATEFRKLFGLEAAQILLGHSRADVTQVYAERDYAKGKEVARRIG